MDDQELPGSTDLQARLDAVERDVRRLDAELQVIRILAARDDRISGPEPAPEAPPPFPRQSVEAATPTRARPAPLPPPKPPRRTPRDLAREWDLVGARGFAIVGGAVTTLGIGFFFVLAANRGWINEQMRLALGVTASAIVLGAGLLLRARYGQYLAALAAVGSGIAGWYATLAAATVRYDIIPDPLALPIAGGIAAVATVIAVRWRSQILAGIGLLGAALAPALQAIDTELTWVSVAFAMIVLLAAAGVSLRRRWHLLLVSSSVIVGLQVEWLVADAGSPAGAGTIGMAAAFAMTLLGIAVGLQFRSRAIELYSLALQYSLSAMLVSLAFAVQLFPDRVDRGTALLAGAIAWTVIAAGLKLCRQPDLATVVAASALTLSAVGTADMISDAALTLAWAAEAVAFAVLARRFADARLQFSAIVYAALATGHALAFAAHPGLLFDEEIDHLVAVLPLVAAAIAMAVSAALAPMLYIARTESGVLASIASLREALEVHRRGIRETLGFAAAALATLAASFAVVAASFEWGHIASSFLAAAIGGGLLGLSGFLRSKGLALASYVWLGVVLVEAVGFDADHFYSDATTRSVGGLSVIAAAIGILGGAYTHRMAERDWRAGGVLAGVAAVIAAPWASLGIGAVSGFNLTALGLGLLVLAALYATLAARVFRRNGFRDYATVLWSLGLLLLIGSESALVHDSVWRAATIALTGAAIALLARPLRETRLWLAGIGVVAVTTLITVLAITPPDHFFRASQSPASGLVALVGCVAAFGAVAWSAQADRQLVLAAVTGGLGLYALSLGILDVAEHVSTASVATDFQRGHTAVSALWALVGLGLLIVGLMRGSTSLRYGGLVLFGLSLAKIFLYDLSELSSVARAFSFILVGGLLLAGGFFLQRLSDRLGPRHP